MWSSIFFHHLMGWEDWEEASVGLLPNSDFDGEFISRPMRIWVVVSNIVYFHSNIGRRPIWLVFFRWVETTNQEWDRLGHAFSKPTQFSSNLTMSFLWPQFGRTTWNSSNFRRHVIHGVNLENCSFQVLLLHHHLRIRWCFSRQAGGDENRVEKVVLLGGGNSNIF